MPNNNYVPMFGTSLVGTRAASDHVCLNGENIERDVLSS